jgi:hypothetical protein
MVRATFRMRSCARHLDGHFQSPLARLVQGADASQEPRGNARVVESTPVLDGPCAFHSCPHIGGGDARVIAAQLFVGDGGHFNVHVNAVQ